MSTTVVALPDLHGRLDLLEGALVLFPQAHFVVLGDVIDRGPRALACVWRLLDLHAGGRATLLTGNHERMALGALTAFRRFQDSGEPADERRALLWFQHWMAAGGDRVRREAGGFGPGSLPPELVRYLDLLWPLGYVAGTGRVTPERPAAPSVLVTHASPPKFTPDFANPFEAALWLRPSDGPYNLPPGVTYSVHGHTPLRAPVRIGDQVYLDLGAWYTGRLALLPLDPAAVGEVTVLRGPGRSNRSLPLPGGALAVRPVALSEVRARATTPG